MKEFFINLFLSADSQDSMMAWIILGITAFLGLILGWLLRGGKVRRLKNQLNETEKRYKLLHAENKQQTAVIQEKSARIETIEANMQSYEQNQFKLRNSLKAAQQEVEQLNKAQLEAGESSSSYEDKITAMENLTTNYETELQEKAQTIKGLQAELLKYQTENKQVEAELEKLMDKSTTSVTPSPVTIQTAFSKIDALENRIQQMENDNQALKNSVLDVTTESEERVGNENLNSLRARINILSEENKDLKKQVSDMSNNGTSDIEHRNRVAELEQENERLRNQMSNGNGLSSGAFVNPNIPTPDLDTDIEPILSEDEMTDEVDRQQVELLKTQKSQFGVMGDRIEVEAVETTTYPNDDLTKIEGIGPFIEKKLNEVGITSFAQLASMDQSEIDQVTAAIQFFPGRIERDNWVGQAGKLMG